MISHKAARERKQLRAMVISGRTRQDMAEELGISYDAVRARLRRANLTATHQFERTVRERAEDMPLKEGFDYLLGVLDTAAEASTSNGYHEVDDLGIDFSGSERRAVITLWDANGDYRSYKQLIKSMRMLDNDYAYGSRESISVLICKIKKKLKGTNYCVENLHGEGWRLKRMGPEE